MIVPDGMNVPDGAVAGAKAAAKNRFYRYLGWMLWPLIVVGLIMAIVAWALRKVSSFLGDSSLPVLWLPISLYRRFGGTPSFVATDLVKFHRQPRTAEDRAAVALYAVERGSGDATSGSWLGSPPVRRGCRGCWWCDKHASCECKRPDTLAADIEDGKDEFQTFQGFEMAYTDDSWDDEDDDRLPIVTRPEPLRVSLLDVMRLH